MARHNNRSQWDILFDAESCFFTRSGFILQPVRACCRQQERRLHKKYIIRTYLTPIFHFPPAGLLRDSLFYQKKSQNSTNCLCSAWEVKRRKLHVRNRVCLCTRAMREGKFNMYAASAAPSVHYLFYTGWWGGAAKPSRLHDRLPVHHGASINTNRCINIHVRAIIVTSWPVLLGKPEYVEGNRTDMAERLWPELEARISSRWSDSANRCIAAPASLCTSALVWKKAYRI